MGFVGKRRYLGPSGQSAVARINRELVSTTICNPISHLSADSKRRLYLKFGQSHSLVIAVLTGSSNLWRPSFSSWKISIRKYYLQTAMTSHRTQSWRGKIPFLFVNSQMAKMAKLLIPASPPSLSILATLHFGSCHHVIDLRDLYQGLAIKRRSRSWVPASNLAWEGNPDCRSFTMSSLLVPAFDWVQAAKPGQELPWNPIVGKRSKWRSWAVGRLWQLCSQLMTFLHLMRHQMYQHGVESHIWARKWEFDINVSQLIP